MATRTDLAGALRDDTESLTAALHSAVSRGEFKGAWKAIAHFTSYGTTASPPVADFTGEGMAVEAIENVIGKLETQIIEKLGSDPRGKLKVRIYEKGCSARPNINFSRSLDFKFSDEEDGNIAQLRAMLVEERNENFRLRNQAHMLLDRVVAISSELAVMGGSAVKSLTEISTVRGQVSAASDAGHLNSAVGVIVLMVMLPLLRESFNLPSNMPLTDVVSLMVRRMKETINGKTSAPKRMDDPPPNPLRLKGGEAEPPVETPTGASTETATTDDSDPFEWPEHPPPPQQVAVWFDNYPDWAADVGRVLTSDPQRMLKLVEFTQ